MKSQLTFVLDSAQVPLLRFPFCFFSYGPLAEISKVKSDISLDRVSKLPVCKWHAQVNSLKIHDSPHLPRHSGIGLFLSLSLSLSFPFGVWGGAAFLSICQWVAWVSGQLEWQIFWLREKTHWTYLKCNKYIINLIKNKLNVIYFSKYSCGETVIDLNSLYILIFN